MHDFINHYLAKTRAAFIARAGSRTAFTLVELLMVIVIMAFVGAIALPKYAGAIGHYRIDAAARRVAADIAYVRTLAMTTSSSQSISFNASSETYTIANVAALDKSSGIYTVNLAGDPYRVNLVSATFASNSSITFNTYGSPDNGGSIVLSNGPIQKTITVDSTTGRTVIQ